MALLVVLIHICMYACMIHELFIYPGFSCCVDGYDGWMDWMEGGREGGRASFHVLRWWGVGGYGGRMDALVGG